MKNASTRTFSLLVFVAVFAAAAIAGEKTGSKEASESIYVHGTKAAPAELAVRASGNSYSISVTGGAIARGASTAADCVIEAQGIRTNNEVTGFFGPVSTDTFLYPKVRADKERRELVMTFESDQIEVVRADTLGYCADGVDFTGTYTLKSK
jgi:hypothetical protein